jgi:hypothetical protein
MVATRTSPRFLSSFVVRDSGNQALFRNKWDRAKNDATAAVRRRLQAPSLGCTHSRNVDATVSNFIVEREGAVTTALARASDENQGETSWHMRPAFLVTFYGHDFGGKLKLIKAICRPFLTWRAAHYRQRLLLDVQDNRATVARKVDGRREPLLTPQRRSLGGAPRFHLGIWELRS